MTLGIHKKKPVKESWSMYALNTTNKSMTLGIPKKKMFKEVIAGGT